MITNDNVDKNAAIDISKISIGNEAIAMGKIKGLTDALNKKEPAGAALAVKNALLGDADPSNTIKVLLDKITTLEGKIDNLERRIAALENPTGV